MGNPGSPFTQGNFTVDWSVDLVPAPSSGTPASSGATGASSGAPGGGSSGPSGSSSGTGSAQSCSWAGQWMRAQGNQATVTLAQSGNQVTGDDGNNDQISATVSGNRLTGRWSHGTDGGAIAMTMDSSCNSFAGTFGYDSGRSPDPLNGTRIGSSPASSGSSSSGGAPSSSSSSSSNAPSASSGTSSSSAFAAASPSAPGSPSSGFSGTWYLSGYFGANGPAVLQTFGTRLIGVFGGKDGGRITGTISSTSISCVWSSRAANNPSLDYMAEGDAAGAFQLVPN